MSERTYKVSEETKQRLISAAGELFAMHSPDAVTVRDICKLAGTKPNAISYHFGGKEGLLEAVWQFALKRWNESRLEKYCNDNKALFLTLDGKRQIVTDVINIIYQNLCAEDQPIWINMFLLRSAISAQGIAYVEKVFGRQVVGVLCKIFRRITGNTDPDTGLCWALNIMSSGTIISASSTDFSSFAPTRKIDYAFYRRLQATVTQNALFAAGLTGGEK